MKKEDKSNQIYKKDNLPSLPIQCLKIILMFKQYIQPGTVAYAAGWGAIITDEKLGPLGFLVPKEQKRPKVLQVKKHKRFK